jgi:hypothetical protein
MEVNGDRKSIQICLDISPLFLYIVSKLVPAVVITYDEIFQALAVEGDVLFHKPFLNLSIDGAVRWKSPPWRCFFSLPST